MKGVPILPSLNNRFSVLATLNNETRYTSQACQTEIDPVTPALSSKPSSKHYTHWQRQHIRSIPSYALTRERSHRSLCIKVELESTFSGQTFAASGIVDCGAMGTFMDEQFVDKNKIPTVPLPRSIPVRNVDGTLNKAGAITRVADMVLRIKGHTERKLFAVTSLGDQQIILGHDWLKDHNP